MNDPIVALVLVGVLSIVCQFVAYKLKLPAILPLLLAGIAVGPMVGVLNADALFDDLLFPIVSLSVAIILFEGALTLRFSDIAGHGKMVRNLCTIGPLVTMLVLTPVTHFILDAGWQVAFLFSAIVTVTGPTVIVPLLRSVRLNSRLSNILRWEGIIIDPIGALLAVIVFEFVVATQDPLLHTGIAFTQTLVTGGLFGLALGYFMGLMVRNSWVPVYLQNTAVLTIMLAAFAASNVLSHESGLLTVTVAGILMTNMRGVDVSGILEFKETLSVLLISALFILLATRLDIGALMSLGWGALLLIACVLFVARPLSVLASSYGANLNWRELAMLSWIAPRGIVAAAVSALFALKLEAQGYTQFSLLVPLVFMVIISTVVVQSLTSVKIAQLLGVRAPRPNGFLIFGSNPFTRMLGKELKKQGINVCLADTNWDAIRQARMLELPVYYGNPISEHASLNLDMSGIGKVLVVSPYRQLNPLVTFHFEHALGKGSTLGLSTREQSQRPSHQVSSDYAQKLCLFDDDATYGALSGKVSRGATLKTTRLTESFSFDDYLNTYGESALCLVAIDPHAKTYVFTSNHDLKPKAEWKVISLIEAEENDNKNAAG
ncbi:cation:proton antiporter [Aestuariibacter salexigens]|uniref:cation:proton antiporter n=1 Tax=Aestuariibacter salexigens TaxID=226010 RepID=UPI000410F692|nr:sodium:proton antiporter [Aestuariibacter salexigens]